MVVCEEVHLRDQKSRAEAITGSKVPLSILGAVINVPIWSNFNKMVSDMLWISCHLKITTIWENKTLATRRLKRLKTFHFWTKRCLFNQLRKKRNPQFIESGPENCSMQEGHINELMLIKLRSARIYRNHLSSKFQLRMNGKLPGQAAPPAD